MYLVSDIAIYCARLSNANYYGLESYYRMSGRNILRPYFVCLKISSFCFKLMRTAKGRAKSRIAATIL